MSKVEIIEELAKLTPDERQEIRLRLAEMDHDDWLDEGLLTDAERALIEARFQDLQANPRASIPLTEARERLMTSFSR